MKVQGPEMLGETSQSNSWAQNTASAAGEMGGPRSARVWKLPPFTSLAWWPEVTHPEPLLPGPSSVTLLCFREQSPRSLLHPWARAWHSVHINVKEGCMEGCGFRIPGRGFCSHSPPGLLTASGGGRAPVMRVFGWGRSLEEESRCSELATA